MCSADRGVTNAMIKAKYTIIGSILLAVGSGLLALAPLEMYCYYLFSEGGRFHYEGFRFGSFMFANISSQIIVYLLIGVALLSLGYGHIKLYSWARKLTIALSYFWLIVGVPVLASFLFVLAASKDTGAFLYHAILVLSVSSYLLLPLAAIRHYGKSKTVAVFATTTQQNWIDSLPVQLVAAILVDLFLIVISILLIFFNGLFPLFGSFKTGICGIMLLDANCILLSILIIGTIGKRRWSWWMSVTYFSVLTASLALTFAKSTSGTILDALALPAEEVKWFKDIPLGPWHFLLLFLPPGILELLNTIVSRKHYQIKAVDRRRGYSTIC